MTMLTDEIRMFVVMALACYDTPAQVKLQVKTHWDLEVDGRQLATYDPTTHVGNRDLGKDLKDLFRETRERFLEKKCEIGMANKMVRLRRLERYVNRLEDRNNLLGAAQILEQIAKEVGESYTNRLVHMGPGGGPLQHEVIMTDAERAAAIVDLFERVAIAQERPAAIGASTLQEEDLLAVKPPADGPEQLPSAG